MHPTPLNVLALSGSLRQGSLNGRLLEAAAALAPEGMALQLCDGLRALPHFDEDLERETHGGPEPVRQLRAQVTAADALLLATPEYNQSFPGVLKNGLDWLSRPGPEEVLVGKPVALLGATPGRWGTRLAQAGLRQVLTATEALVLPAPAVFVPEAERLFDGSGRLQDTRTQEALRALLHALARWTRSVTAESSAAPGTRPSAARLPPAEAGSSDGDAGRPGAPPGVHARARTS
ncbi:NADPH-dependent FMN reductase [Myxococcus sp. Y35]|uniref:NADPH-dependent FMN reductase n=1 Tax=Pseudomyxococcus flavus TaxID=3115648 RepID=UPI003CE6731C